MIRKNRLPSSFVWALVFAAWPFSLPADEPAGPPDFNRDVRPVLSENCFCQALSSDLWTDFNLHDPGLTILEVLTKDDSLELAVERVRTRDGRAWR